MDQAISNKSDEKIGRSGWLIVLGTALILRLIVLASGSVSFHSDEAIIGLMARHINQGLPIPTFFYGQPYMGSLDALLAALSFRLFGENVFSIRIVQSILYLLIVVTTVLLARQISGRRWIAVTAGLLVAVPPVVLTLYSTMTLGGYGETLLFGNLVLLLGDSVTRLCPNSRWRWALLGLIAGLAWWTNALIAVYALPIVIFGLARFSIRRWSCYGLAAAAFFVGGAPWWLYNFSHNWDALHWLLNGSQNNNGLVFTPGYRVLGFVFVGLPAVLGIRYPWQSASWAGLLALPIAAFYILVLSYALIAAIRRADAERFLTVYVLSFTAVFIGSAFGADVTGRYLLPLIPPLSILVAIGLYTLWQGQKVISYGLLAGLLIFAGAGNLNAVLTVPPGLTSQFDPVNDFTNTYDQQVIDFLVSHNATVGYGTYWVTFRLAFLSQERVILDAWLPNKASLLYTPMDRRYTPYTRQVEAAEHPVYVTANVPFLDVILIQRFEQVGVTYQQQAIGPYVIYYDLSRKITPDNLGLYTLGNATSGN